MDHYSTRVAALSRMTGVDQTVVAALVGPLLVVDQDYKLAASLATDDIAAPAVRFCLLHGITPDLIADTLDLPHNRVQRHARSRTAPTAQALHCVQLAMAGRSVTEIMRELNVNGRGWVYRTLGHAGVTPKPFGERAATNAGQRAATIRMYRDGVTYSEIARKTGLSVDNVKNVLRAAARRGDLPEYGSRRLAAAS